MVSSTIKEQLAQVLSDAKLTRIILHNEFDAIEEKSCFEREGKTAVVTAYIYMVRQFRECLRACDFIDNTVMNEDEEERETLVLEYKNAPKESAYREQLRVLLKEAGIFG